MKNEQDASRVIDNLEKLQEEVKMAGFDNYFKEAIAEKIAGGEKEFTLTKAAEIDAEKVDYVLHFRVDEPNRRAYFNNMDVRLSLPDGAQRTHTFPRYQHITAKEAFNLLKYGELTAVYKTLFAKEATEPYHAWITLDLKGPKDEYNNYASRSYHENYYQKQPFEIQQALTQLPLQVKELEQPLALRGMEALLKKGSPVEVTVMHEEQEKKALLFVNAKAGSIDIYDTNLQLLAAQKQQQDDVKKKPEQKVNWNGQKPKNQQRRI